MTEAHEYCQCHHENGQLGQWVMEIHEGDAVLKHLGCGKYLYFEAYTTNMDETPVKVSLETACDSRLCRGQEDYGVCDCDQWLKVEVERTNATDN